MAFSRTAKATAAAETFTLDTSGFSVTAGDLLVLCVASKNTVTATLRKTSDSSLVQTFTQAATIANSTAVRTTMLYLPNTTNPGENVFVRVSHGGAGTVAATVSAVSDAAQSSPLDKTQTGTGSGTSPSSGDTATTEEAPEILFGAIGTAGPSTDGAGSWDGLFTAGQRVGTAGTGADVTISEGFRIVSATGIYSAAKTGIASADWAAAIGTFKAPPFIPYTVTPIMGPILAR